MNRILEYFDSVILIGDSGPLLWYPIFQSLLVFEEHSHMLGQPGVNLIKIF